MHENPYQARIDRVRAHVAVNLAGDLSLDRLAEVAALSRFHFHRVFAAMTGETVAEAVRRARLNRAAVLVVIGRMPMAGVARTCGYPNVQSFARAFSRAFATTPSALRRGGRLPRPLLPQKPGDLPMFPVRIDTLPERRLAAFAHQGAYPMIATTFSRLFLSLRDAGLLGRIGFPGVALYHDSPAEVPVADLRSHAAFSMADDLPLPAPYDDLRLAGGRHAVLTFRGPYTGLPAAWDWIYGQWLPGSGEVPADRAPFEMYLNDAYDTAPEDLLTEVCVPLVTRA
jgi:AraC family transcriptional regulator